MRTVMPLRIVFDKNVPVGARRFLTTHEVHTFAQMGWPAQIENGELLRAAEEAGFDVVVTSDQNIRYQQNFRGRRIALVVLCSNIWPIVRTHAAEIAANVRAATPGSYRFVEDATIAAAAPVTSGPCLKACGRQPATDSGRDKVLG